MNKQEEKILSDMFEELEKSSSIYHPSKFWDRLNRVHLEFLSKTGFNNFKRTVNAKYFNWGSLGIVVHQFSPVLRELLRANFAPLIKSSFKDAKMFNYIEALTYRVYLASLFEYVSQHDELKILDNLEEPLLGNPFLVKYKDKLISQDLCNSVFDFYATTHGTHLPKRVKIAEIGAGYGRLGYVLLKMLPSSTYCIIDIPPALFIAQNYLSKVFPKERVFRFRPFKSFKEVREEFEQSRIQFMMPHQIALLPNKYFDLFINISSLHEMTRDQIKNYIKQINRICKGYFYTKQWRRSRTQDNQFIKEREYPIPKNWKTINHRSRHPIQNMFFDRLYKIE